MAKMKIRENVDRGCSVGPVPCLKQHSDWLGTKLIN
jgi:hypothetical protein